MKAWRKDISLRIRVNRVVRKSMRKILVNYNRSGKNAVFSKSNVGNKRKRLISDLRKEFLRKGVYLKHAPLPIKFTPLNSVTSGVKNEVIIGVDPAPGDDKSAEVAVNIK